MRNFTPFMFALGLSAVAGLGACGNEQALLGALPDHLKRGEQASGDACGGLTGLPCRSGEFCKYAPEDLCGAADATGVCSTLPEACTEQFEPMCGCDGKTYGNACEAYRAGISVSAEGACDGDGNDDGDGSAGGEPPVDPDHPLPGCGPVDGGPSEPRICGGLAALPCGDGEFCNYEVEAGGLGCIADATGVCQPRPEVCTREYAPVCGCDGKTYSNSCEAHAAGASIVKKGECEAAQVNCDPRDVLCKRATPKCPEGTVPSVVGSCYGDCVPAEQCGCSEAAECPLPDQYTCHLSAGHCGPFVN